MNQVFCHLHYWCLVVRFHFSYSILVVGRCIPTIADLGSFIQDDSGENITVDGTPLSDSNVKDAVE